MGKNKDRQSTDRQHDEKLFRAGLAIFSQDDLREMINFIYSEYQYKGTQLDKLAGLISFFASESNKYIDPEFAGQSQRLRDWLDNFMDFLQRNFHQENQIGDNDRLYLLTMGNTGFETEAFLAEFQMLALDIEKAYRSYYAVIISKLGT